MPITQVRFAALIAAAQGALDANRALCARITHCAAMPDAEAALASIAEAAQSTLFAASAEHIAIITREAEHLRLTRARNVRAARAMRRKRRRPEGPAPRTPLTSDAVDWDEAGALAPGDETEEL